MVALCPEVLARNASSRVAGWAFGTSPMGSFGHKRAQIFFRLLGYPVVGKRGK